MNSSQQKSLKCTIQKWSDDQFSLVVERLEELSASDFLAGIRILAGEHAYLKAKEYASSFQPPEIKGRMCEGVGPDESSQAWNMLQNRVQALPPELFQLVKSWTLKSALLGDIKLDLTSKPLDALKCIRDQVHIGLLSHLDRKDYLEYKDRLLAENLWIIPSSPVTYEKTNASDHMYSFLSQIPVTQLSKISRLKVSFAQQDYFYIDLLDSWRLGGFCDEWLLFMLLPDWQHRKFPNHMLCDAWESKAMFIAYIFHPHYPFNMHLEELVLDFKDAKGPNGVFYGARLAMYLASLLSHSGLDADVVTVEAHTPEAAEHIWRILLDVEYRMEVVKQQEENERSRPSI